MKTKKSKTTNLVICLIASQFALLHPSMAGPQIINNSEALQPIQNKLHWGLLKSSMGQNQHNDLYKAAMHSGIWLRMRQQFKMNYPKSDPRIQRHIRYIVRSPDYIDYLKINGEPFLYHIVEAIEQRGLPLEIALLPMIESKFDPHTTSTAGAEGLWQIMPGTGKILGLKQDSWFQGTRDLDASTKGALNHLHYLGQLFKGDWLLALAAYNSGENRVLRAIKKNQAAKKPTHFWDLDLPKETKEYVPKFLALVSIIKDPGKYNVALPIIPNKPYFAHVELHRPIKLSDAAHLTGLKEKEIKRLNPGLRREVTHPNGPFKILVPYAQAENLKNNFMQDQASYPVLGKYQIYKVKENDTLLSIAQDFETTVEKIQELNNLASEDNSESENIKMGKILLLDIV